MRFDAKIRKTKNSFRVIIPKVVMREMLWKQGDIVKLWTEEVDTKPDTFLPPKRFNLVFCSKHNTFKNVCNCK